MRKKGMIVATVLLLMTVLAGNIPAETEKEKAASSWEVLSYLDEDGNETEEQFVFGESDGTFTTLEGIEKELVATVFVDRQDVMIGLWKEGKTRVTNSSKTEVREYTVTINPGAENSDISIDAIMPPGAERIYLRTMEVRDGKVYYNSNQEKVVELLKNGTGTVNFAVKEAETYTAYNFRIDASDFQDYYYELESDEKKATFIEAVDQIDLTDSDAISQLKKAGEALDELSDGDKKELSEYVKTYEASDKEYHEKRIDNVSKLIEAIGEVSLDSSEEAINEAKEAYDKLTSEEQEQVTNADILTEAVEEFRKLKEAHEAEIKENAGKVTALIDEIANTEDTGDSDAVKNEEIGEKIYQAKTAYEDLTEEEQDLVTNAKVLESAYDSYEENVISPAREAILAIGEVTLESGETIEKAKEKVSLVSPSWRDGLEEINKLEQAEGQYQELLLTRLEELTEQLPDADAESIPVILSEAEGLYDKLTEDGQNAYGGREKLSEAEQSAYENMANIIIKELNELDAEKDSRDFAKMQDVLERYEKLPDKAKEYVKSSDRIEEYKTILLQQEDYEAGLKLLEDNDYAEAYYSFLRILEYSDSKSKAEEILALCGNRLDSGSGYQIFAPPGWKFLNESATSSEHLITWADADENAELKFTIYNKAAKSTEEIYDEEKNLNNRNVSFFNVQDNINAVYWTEENSSTLTWSDPEYNLVYEIVMDVKDAAKYENTYQQMVETVFDSLYYEDISGSITPKHFTYVKRNTDQVLYDNPNCYLAVTNVYEADWTNGIKMALYVENRTDKELELSIQGIKADLWELGYTDFRLNVAGKDYKLWFLQVSIDPEYVNNRKIHSIQPLLRVTEKLSGDVLHEDRMYIKP